MKRILITTILLLTITLSFAQPQLWGLTAKGGTDSAGNLFTIKGDGSNFQSVYSWQLQNVGKKPSLLCEGSIANKVYGIANEGGANNLGVLFSYDYAAQVYTVLKQLDSSTGYDCKGGMVKNINGKLYGTMKFGGTNNEGTLFEYDESTNSFSVLKNFASFATGANPQGTLVSSGSILYGCTTIGTSWSNGGVFKYDLLSPNIITPVFDFLSLANSGYQTSGYITQSASGKLYVCTQRGLNPPIFDPLQGALIEIDPSNNYAATIKLNFGVGVEVLLNKMIYINNGTEKLIGSTVYGGTNFEGSIVEYNITNNTYTTKQHFNNNIVGTNAGGILCYNNNDTIIGITQNGGAFGNGTLFRYIVSSASIDTLQSLQSSITGYADDGFGGFAFIPSTNKFLGSLVGSLSNNGTIVSSNYPASNSLQNLIHFNIGPNGLYPQASLTAKDGFIYGTTVQGGSYTSGNHNVYGDYSGFGTLFKYHPPSSTYYKLYDFNNTNGAFPSSDLVADTSGSIYGTTMHGGSGGFGTIFKYDVGANFMQVVHEFDMLDGSTPASGLTDAGTGIFYGVTNKGGLNDLGIMYSFQPSTNSFQKIRDFDSSFSGGNPIGKLFYASDNKLYGLSSTGGSQNAGVFFSYDTGGTFTTILDFNANTSGANPLGSFTELNGKLYALLSNGGSSNEGTIIEYDLTTQAIAINQNLTGHPKGTLLKASNNMLYGLAHNGGSHNKGFVFSSDVLTNTSTTIGDFDGSNGANPAYGSLIEFTPCPTLNPPAAINGKATFCEGTTQIFYADTVTTATSFNWTVPSDWNIVSGQGTDTIHVTIGASSGNIEVNVSDGCSTSSNYSNFKGIVPLPTVPAAIFNGPAISCPSINHNYSTLNNGGADSFTWVVPTGWQIVSGQGTTDVTLTTNSIAANDTIKVKGNNTCGSSAFTVKAVHIYPPTPAQPGTITGNTSPCNGSNTYSIDPVDGASSYEWTIPNGWSYIANNNLTSIIVNVNSAIGDITVKAVGSCNGSKSIAKTLTITRPTLLMPQSIIGDSIVCVNTNQTFTVSNVAGASSYVWDVPLGWTIISGQNTNAITLKPTESNASGVLKVTALSNCAVTSPNKGKVIIADGNYSFTPIVYGSVTAKPNTIVAYSTYPIALANSYNWTVPSGWNILSGQGTTQVQVQTGTAGGNISFTATKSCNGIATKVLPIEMNNPTTATTPVFIGNTGGSNSIIESGTVYTLGADSSSFMVSSPFADSTTLFTGYHFGNYGSNYDLVKAGDGNMYGIGKNGSSPTLISFNPSTGMVATKLVMDGLIDNHAMAAANDGNIYIANSAGSNGQLQFLKYNTATNQILLQKRILQLQNKYASVQTFFQASNNNIYGLAQSAYIDSIVGSGYELFELNTITNTYTTLYEFKDTAIGLFPVGKLLQASNGLLYGLLGRTDTSNKSGIYSFDIATRTISKLYSGCNNCDFAYTNKQPMIASNGKMYGTESQNLFEFDIATNTYTIKRVINGFNGQLTEPIAGKLYGLYKDDSQVYIDGNIYDAIFDYSTATNTFISKKTFPLINNPIGYEAVTIHHGGNNKLYGYTTKGGLGSLGSLYEYDIANNALSAKKTVGYVNGKQPGGAMIKANNGKFYGTTLGIRNYDGIYYDAGEYKGTIFEYDTATQATTIKHQFLIKEGFPIGSMLLASNCKLYGWASENFGSYGNGSSLYEYNPATDSFAVKLNLPNSSSYVTGEMIEHAPMKFIGVTSNGSNNKGGIYEYDLYSNTYTLRYSFDSDADGYNPVGILTKAANGKIYGIAQRGITSNPSNPTALVVFEYNPNTYTCTKKTQLDFIEEPNAGLTEAAYGKFYGVFKRHQTNNAYDKGGIFEYDYLTNTITLKQAFPYVSYSTLPQHNQLLKASDGNLYGVLTAGGNLGLGAAYQYNPTTNQINTIKTFNGVNGHSPLVSRLTEINPITASTIYYSKATGNLNELNTWGMNTNGTGTAPANFTSDNKVFIISNNNSKTINANWSISGFNTKVFVGNGNDSTALNIADGFTLTVTDKATLNVSNKGTINIAPNAVLDVNNNATVNCNCNSNLTLQSSAAGTARLASLTNGGYVYGNVKTERYIPGGYRKFRFLGHPFTYPMNMSEWTDDIDITGSITGTNANNFTASGSNNPSAFTFTEANGNGASNDAGWTAATSSSIASTLGISQGIRILIRGSKNQAGSLTGGTYTPNPVTLNMKGVLQQGDFVQQLSYSGASKGWNLLCNPYPSNIDWNTVTKTNVNDAVYTYRPSLNGGTYASFINGSSTNGGSNILESHVGFFVRANANAASLTFHENDKVATAQPNTMFRNTNTQNQIHSKVKLRLVADSLQYTDEIVVRFGDDNATDNFDEQYDAFNIAGNAHDLYALDTKENKYSIYHGSELKPWQDEDREIKLGVTVANKGKYSINAMLLNEMSNGNIAFLKDSYKQTLTVITDSISYVFEVTDSAASKGENRFSIVFNPEEKQVIASTKGLTVSPNPSTENRFVLSTGKAYKQLSIQLNDATGKTIFTKETKGINNNQSISIQTPNLAAGTYYITAISEHGKETFIWMKL